jgi:hypothetical protein
LDLKLTSSLTSRADVGFTVPTPTKPSIISEFDGAEDDEKFSPIAKLFAIARVALGLDRPIAILPDTKTCCFRMSWNRDISDLI